jgi:glycosyltransferase involved in cell wall biosynthesis
MYDEVFRMVEALGLRERLKFTGYIPTQDLPLIYNLAEIFIYPSMYEGFGLPPLEAMACGTPVITTAVSSMPEHVGKAGVLVPPDDEGALARAILGLVNDDELRRRLAVEGPRQAAQFTWARTARETLQVYRRVLGLA